MKLTLTLSSFGLPLLVVFAAVGFTAFGFPEVGIGLGVASSAFSVASRLEVGDTSGAAAAGVLGVATAGFGGAGVALGVEDATANTIGAGIFGGIERHVLARGLRAREVFSVIR